MNESSAIWVPATPGDAAAVHALVKAFYTEEQLVYDESRTAPALDHLLATAELGVVFLLNQNHQPRGYFILTYGFSLEFGGRFVLLDELYLHPTSRSQGLGRLALQTAESWTRDQQIDTLRLEVNQHNDKAMKLYVKAGFGNDQRRILTKWVMS